MSQKLAKREEIEAKIKTVGVEKFQNYADKHSLYIDEVTYGIRKIFHKNKMSYCEAVDAVKINSDNSVIEGWLINKPKHGRKFISTRCGYKVC